jgi:two-component system, sensor histidine kinase and response regulator
VSVASDNPAQKIRVLIVEDDTLQSQILESVLVAKGFEVDTVSSGLNAMRLIWPRHYDVILVDYHIPEINGLAIAKLANDFMGQLVRPVLIAVTATPEHLSAVESEAPSVFDAIISKSSDFSNLFDAIARGLAAAADRTAMQTAEYSLVHRDWLDYEPAPRPPQGQGGDPGPIRVLVIDDDEIQCQLLASALKSRGYVVAIASDGLEAVRDIRQHFYDLALVDYNLPEIDGLTVATIVHELMPEVARPRLIAFTAQPDLLMKQEMTTNIVFDQILDKSLGLHELICSVDDILKSSPNPTTRAAAELCLPMRHPCAGRSTRWLSP